jgi:hydrogenase expression/formation protein HypD
VPIVVTGFEPLDLLQGICMCLAQLEQGRFEVETQYARVVCREGNSSAQDLVSRMFRDVHRKWRGIGEIPQSGFSLTPEFAAFDAESRFGVAEYTAQEAPECQRGTLHRDSPRARFRPRTRSSRPARRQ